MREYLQLKAKYNIISVQVFFFIFMILLTKINSAMINLIINKRGNQQILHKNFETPSEIIVNNQPQNISSFDYFVNLQEGVNNIMIKWNQVIQSCQKMFYGLKSIISIEFIDFDTSSVTNMESMFNGCTNLVSLNLSNFNVSSVTDMSSMFYDCKSLKSLDLSTI